MSLAKLYLEGITQTFIAGLHMCYKSACRIKLLQTKQNLDTWWQHNLALMEILMKI